MEVGEGLGRGYTLNLPIAPGTSEREYLDVFESQVVPKIASYGPQFILISAGFDAHVDDPLGGLMLTESGFATLTRRLRDAAVEFCNGRLISCLEGGYNLPALQLSTAAHVKALME